MKAGWVLAAVAALQGPAAAQAVDESTARKMLFSTRGDTVQISPDLSPRDAATVKALIPLMAEQLRQPVRYYASIAYSPQDGLVHDALQAAMNYHTPQAADRAAIAACDRIKTKGAPSCRVAARVLPRKWEPRGLTLSVDATAGFDKGYRKQRGAKAFAISRSTGAWGYGPGDAAAVAACEKAASPGDCEIVIRD